MRRHYFHGLPYAQAASFDASVVPTLLEMLSSEEDEQYYSNIVVMLGIVGDDEVFDELQSFVSADGGELSYDRFRAASSAVISLGYLANRAGSDQAIDYLAGGLQPDNWNDRLPWTSPYHENADSRNSDFTQASIIGLALSGRESGMAALRSLTPGGGGVMPVGAEGVLSEALEAHREIDQGGLDAYYETKMR